MKTIIKRSEFLKKLRIDDEFYLLKKPTWDNLRSEYGYSKYLDLYFIDYDNALTIAIIWKSRNRISRTVMHGESKLYALNVHAYCIDIKKTHKNNPEINKRALNE